MRRVLKDPKTISRLLSGPLGCCMQQIVAEAVGQQYSAFTIRKRLQVIHKFGCWLQRCHIPVDQLTAADAQRFLARHGKIKHGDVESLRQLFCTLAGKGLIRKAPAPIKTESEKIVEDFGIYLHQERGLAPGTTTGYKAEVQQFLRYRFGKNQVNLRTLTAKSAIQFVNKEVARLRSMRPKITADALKAFFRYLHYRGFLANDLSTSVPSVACRPFSKTPRGLSRDQANRVLAACDKSTPIGRRDYAILLLLARLGLRSGEIVRLKLEDIDWTAGTISIGTKGGRDCKMPLLHDVGKAIAVYLHKDRPHIKSPFVFLRVPAPAMNFEGHRAVTLIVKYALARAGLDLPSKGAHQFRHTLATEMLRNGASLFEIGEILRHRKAKTTSIYAKVDFAALRPLALPWPGGVK